MCGIAGCFGGHETEWLAESIVDPAGDRQPIAGEDGSVVPAITESCVGRRRNYQSSTSDSGTGERGRTCE